MKRAALRAAVAAGVVIAGEDRWLEPRFEELYRVGSLNGGMVAFIETDELGVNTLPGTSMSGRPGRPWLPSVSTIPHLTKSP